MLQLGYAQNVLTEETAVQMALEHNFGIQLAENQLQIAENNTSKFNTGTLPTIALDAGGNFRLDNTTAVFQDGRETKVSAAESGSMNTSLNVGYTLFDGYFRKYNIEQLQNRYQLTELQLKATMENIAAQTLIQYYTIATIAESLEIQSRAIEISQDRLERSQVQYEYGGDQLAILNAQVDLNNDSLNYYQTENQLDIAKRNLNNLLVEHKDLDYSVITDISFIDYLPYDELLQSMIEQNVELKLMDKNIEIGQLNIQLAEARKLPTVSANGSYGFNYAKNNAASFLSSSNANGLTLGLSMRWNIFDGGATKVAIENAKINALGLALEKQELLQTLQLEFDQAWADYENKKLIYETERKNLSINQENFARTEEKFKIGQVNSTEFRQAQLNLFQAESNLNTAKFAVKTAEIQLLLLSGRILN